MVWGMARLPCLEGLCYVAPGVQFLTDRDLPPRVPVHSHDLRERLQPYCKNPQSLIT